MALRVLAEAESLSVLNALDLTRTQLMTISFWGLKFLCNSVAQTAYATFYQMTVNLSLGVINLWFCLRRRATRWALPIAPAFVVNEHSTFVWFSRQSRRAAGSAGISETLIRVSDVKRIRSPSFC